MGPPLGLSISGSIQEGSEAWGPGVSTSRGNGSLGQAQFGEASREAEELLAQTEETWGVEREKGLVSGCQWVHTVWSGWG